MSLFLISVLLAVLATEGGYQLRRLGEAIRRPAYYKEFGFSTAYLSACVLGIIAVFPDMGHLQAVLGPFVVGFTFAVIGWVRS